MIPTRVKPVHLVGIAVPFLLFFFYHTYLTYIDAPSNGRTTSRRVMLLHVGPPKTGSTSMQYELKRMLTANHSDLYGLPLSLGHANNEHLYLYLQTLAPTVPLGERGQCRFSDGTLQWMCTHGQNVSKALRTAVSECRYDAVLSCEGFALLTVDLLRLLRDEVRPCYDIRVVHFYRSFASHTYSRWRQFSSFSHVEGRLFTFEEYAAEMASLVVLPRAPNEDRDSVDEATRLVRQLRRPARPVLGTFAPAHWTIRRMAAVFGRANIRLVSMEGALQRQRSLTSAALEAGLPEHVPAFERSVGAGAIVDVPSRKNTGANPMLTQCAQQLLRVRLLARSELIADPDRVTNDSRYVVKASTWRNDWKLCSILNARIEPPQQCLPVDWLDRLFAPVQEQLFAEFGTPYLYEGAVMGERGPLVHCGIDWFSRRSHPYVSEFAKVAETRRAGKMPTATVEPVTQAQEAIHPTSEE